MNEKILLINVHSSKNVGDEALLFTTLKQLYDNFPRSSILLCMDDPSSHKGPEISIPSFFTWVLPFDKNKKARWNYLRLLLLIPSTLIPLVSQRLLRRKIWLFSPHSIRSTIKGYLDANLVVSKPGGFLYTSGRGVSLFIAVYSILYAVWAGKPVYILPQSIGPFQRQWESALIARLLEQVRIVMVREPVSLKLIQDMHLRNRNIVLLPDLAFGLPELETQDYEKWLLQNQIVLDPIQPVMGMTIIDWGAQNKTFTQQSDYERACANAIKYFIENIHGRVILFPQVYGPLSSQDDRIPAHRVQMLIPEHADSIRVIDNPVPPELLKTIYGKMDIFIGTRMHSNIFALSKGVPVIAIGYLHKTKGIAEMVGIGKWVINITQATGIVIKERLAELWPIRQEWHKKIMEKVPILIDQASKAGNLVASDYYRKENYIKWKND